MEPQRRETYPNWGRQQGHDSILHHPQSRAGADGLVLGFAKQKNLLVFSAPSRRALRHERAPSLSNADPGICKALMGKKGRWLSLGINTFPFTKGQARPPLCWYCKWERGNVVPLFPKAGSPFHTRYSLHFLAGGGVPWPAAFLPHPHGELIHSAHSGLRALPWAPSHGCSW